MTARQRLAKIGVFLAVWLWLAALSVLIAPAIALADTVVVTGASDVSDGNTASIAALNANPGPDGVISLREAIAAARNTAGADLVAFDIPDSDAGYQPALGVWRIEPTTSLQLLGNETTIDGRTQGYAQGDRNPDGPEIEIRGSRVALGTSGFIVSGNDNALRGLAVTGYRSDEPPGNLPNTAAILVTGQGNTIEYCYLGLDPSGHTATGNYTGIAIPFALPTATQLTTIRFNVISGNTYAGIYVQGKARIQANMIGTDPTGEAGIANRIGIFSYNTSSDLQIGGMLLFDGNTIAYNTDDGIRWFGGSALAAGSAPAMSAPALLPNSYALRNHVFGNGGQGIDGAPSKVTHLPSILSTDPVTGTACAGCRVELFSSEGAQQGQAYEGFATADAAGVWHYFGFPAGPYLTATATGPISPTSGFAPPTPLWPVLLVDSAVDTSDGDTSGVAALQADPGPDSAISLREAIQAVNAQAGASPVIIGFDIPPSDAGYDATSGAWRIEPSPDLPCISAGQVWLDGATQARNQGDTNLLGPEIVLSQQASQGFGLHLCSDDNLVRGLAIGGWQTGLLVNGNGNTVQGNYIGVDARGLTDHGNYRGIVLGCQEGAPNLIGGRAPGAGNLISGNDGYALYRQCSTSGRQMTVSPEAHSETTSPGAPPDSFFAVVQGNRIGTDRTGTASLGNGFGAIWFENALGNSIIGGTAAGAGNAIAFNGMLPAVSAQDCGYHTIRRNSIYANAGLGIGRLVACPNLSLPPTIDAVCLATSSVLGHSGCLSCTVEIFADEADEGQVYLGQTLTDASGHFTFTGELPGPHLTATATTPDGNTSQFSQPAGLRSPDVNCDGRVDIRDVQAVAGGWLSTPASPAWNPAYDQNGDDVVNIADIQAVAEAWPQP